mgnify:CR=1 FL=1
MEKIIFFGLVIPIFAFVLYLGGNAIMKGMSAKNANKESENLENDEIENSYKDGGEWCGYGWSDGQMALYPTQKKTFAKLQTVQIVPMNLGS